MHEDTAEESDEEIAKLVQNGDREAFGILIKRYGSKITRYGKKFLYQYEDIEDAVQDIFIKAYTNIQSFNTAMKFSPWIYRIAHNTFINIIKKKGREPITFFDFDTLLQYSGNENTVEKDIYAKDNKKELERAISKLDPKYRESIVLYYFEEKDYKEIADILRIPVSTVGVRIKRAREKIKSIYQTLHQYE